MASLTRSCLTAVLTAMLCLAGTICQAEEQRFDHFATGFELRGAHRDIPCESCHLRGLFDGTPRQCELCHAGNSLLATSFKPTDHIPSSGSCDSCHDVFNWQEITRVDHMQLPQACGICHNGLRLEGKPPDHVSSGQQCELCHSTMAWLPALFDHATVSQPCFSCHDNRIAEGKSSSHITTTLDC
jgi:hypothetical protein